MRSARGSRLFRMSVFAAALLISLATATASAANASAAGPSGARCFASAANAAAGTCVRRLPGRTPVRLPSRATDEATDIVVPAQCGFAPGTAIDNPDRFTSCSDTVWELYTYTTTNGVVSITGALDVEDYQWTSYSVNSLSWSHGLILNVHYGATGTLANGTGATVSSDCDVNPTCAVSASQGTPDPQSVQLVPGTSVATGWTEFDTGPASASAGQESFQDLLGVSFAGPGATGIAWSFQDSYLGGRCDSIVSSVDGCVNQEFVPTLSLSLADYGASAAMIQWAQQNLTAKWGVQGAGQPLHRLANSSEQRKNRAVVCDSSFIPDVAMTAALAPYNDADSCDEFPFASSYESAALDGHTTSGSQCAQTTAVQIPNPSNDHEAADWPSVTATADHTGAEPCVRGHIPLKLNKGVGGAYSALIQSSRLVDEDAYWVAVTS